eukprot:symbB.v1.2.008455.t1/scaffold429.1/size206233/11
MVQTIELGEMARTSFEEEESAGRPQILAQLAKDISELIRNARGGRETEPLEAEATKTTSLERLRALQRKEPIVEPIVPVPAEPPYPPEAEKRQDCSQLITVYNSSLTQSIRRRQTANSRIQ